MIKVMSYRLVLDTDLLYKEGQKYNCMMIGVNTHLGDGVIGVSGSWGPPRLFSNVSIIHSSVKPWSWYLLTGLWGVEPVSVVSQSGLHLHEHLVLMHQVLLTHLVCMVFKLIKWHQFDTNIHCKCTYRVAKAPLSSSESSSASCLALILFLLLCTMS